MDLVHFVGLLTLAHHPSREREWPLAKKFREIKAAGFEGICAPLDFAVASVAAEHGLFSVGMIFPDEPSQFVRILGAQKPFGPRFVNVQLGTHQTTPAEAVKRWIKLEKEATLLGIEVFLETHRDSATETPDKLFELADRYEASTGRTLRLAWDFSHLAVVKHLHTGQLVERLLARPQLIQSATQFSFRPFNGHHAQLPVTHNGKLTPEVSDFLEFTEEVMKMWKSAAANRDRTLYSCASLGPKGGYALSNFPAVWPDAIVLKDQLQQRWENAG